MRQHQAALLELALAALAFSDNFIDIEPHEHVAEDAAEGHRKLREAITALRNALAAEEAQAPAPAGLTKTEKAELLDWVTACQSAYSLENNPHGPFAALPGQLQENCESLVRYVEDLIAERVAQKLSEACLDEPVAEVLTINYGGKAPAAFVAQVLCESAEYYDLPVRQGEKLYARPQPSPEWVDAWREGAKFALKEVAKSDVAFITDSMLEVTIKLATEACIKERDRLKAER